jgi:hypothetical protein
MDPIAIPPPPEPPRLPSGVRETARWLYRQDIPLGCTAGRAAAEDIFGVDLDTLPMLGMDRYRVRMGWLATWSRVIPLPRRLELRIAALMPIRGAVFDDTLTTPRGGRMRVGERAFLIRVAPDLPQWGYDEGVWSDWPRMLAKRHDCPELAQEWPA